MKKNLARESRLVETLLFALLSIATALAAVTVLTFAATFSSGALIVFSILIAAGMIFFVLSAVFAYEAYVQTR
jgi:hypothetical protein